MRLSQEEEEILAGERGRAARWGLEHQMTVGGFFGAEELVRVRSAHIHCDGEAVGEVGTSLLEEWAAAGARTSIPLTVDPRSADLDMEDLLGQGEVIRNLEHRIIDSLARMGAIVTNTCINYQTVDPPHLGEHLAWGDTGAVIFANSVAGARTNFEGGAAALAAAFCGRAAAYGFHLEDRRQATILVTVAAQPRHRTDWGALGALIGRKFPSYWHVPLLEGVQDNPSTDELKQLGAALASYGSHAMFHMRGITPEGESAWRHGIERKNWQHMQIGEGDFDALYDSFGLASDYPDLMVFGTPQCSLLEVRELAESFDGHRVRCPVLVTTTPAVRRSAQDLGYARTLSESGVMLLGGVCFYLMTARQLARENGYRVLWTDSAKLANIIEGYGYEAILRPTEQCIARAIGEDAA